MKNNPRLAAVMWAAAMGMAAHVGCGGRVIVDGLPGEGGAGQGQGGSGAITVGPTTVGQGSGGANGPGCGFSPGTVALTNCGGSAVGATGGMLSCQTSLCDPAGNKFDALCQANTCVCQINGITKCSCSLQGPGNFCAGTTPCCPWSE